MGSINRVTVQTNHGKNARVYLKNMTQAKKARA
jgi:hypothetical protein